MSSKKTIRKESKSTTFPNLEKFYLDEIVPRSIKKFLPDKFIKEKVADLFNDIMNDLEAHIYALSSAISEYHNLVIDCQAIHDAIENDGLDEKMMKAYRADGGESFNVKATKSKAEDSGDESD